jgi:hypothetical protein
MWGCWIWLTTGSAFAQERVSWEATAWGAWSDPRQEAGLSYPGGPSGALEVGIWSSDPARLYVKMGQPDNPLDTDPETLPRSSHDVSAFTMALRASQYTLAGPMGPHVRSLQLVSSESAAWVRPGGLGVALEAGSALGVSYVNGQLEERTELQDPYRVHFSRGLELGARLYLPGPVSVSYRTTFMAVEEPWRLGHQLVQAGLMVVTRFAAHAPLPVIFEDPHRQRVASLLVLAAVNTGWLLVDVRQHNWPFDDPVPLRMNAHMIGVTFRY